jgi:hypothetical protein
MAYHEVRPTDRILIAVSVECRQGGNKPLEADEAHFLDSITQQERAHLRFKRAEEEKELESFKVLFWFQILALSS